VNVSYRIDDLDQIGKGVCPASNFVRWFIDEWPQADTVRGSALAAMGGGSRRGTMAAHRRFVARQLWCCICYDVSSNGFRTTWGTHFTNLGQRRRGTPSGRRWCSSLRLDRRRGNSFDASPVCPRPRMTSSRPPLAPPGNELARAVADSCS
jgi:hypothetical protein